MLTPSLVCAIGTLRRPRLDVHQIHLVALEVSVILKIKAKDFPHKRSVLSFFYATPAMAQKRERNLMDALSIEVHCSTRTCVEEQEPHSRW